MFINFSSTFEYILVSFDTGFSLYQPTDQLKMTDNIHTYQHHSAHIEHLPKFASN